MKLFSLSHFVQRIRAKYFAVRWIRCEFVYMVEQELTDAQLDHLEETIEELLTIDKEITASVLVPEYRVGSFNVREVSACNHSMHEDCTVLLFKSGVIETVRIPYSTIHDLIVTINP